MEEFVFTFIKERKMVIILSFLGIVLIAYGGFLYIANQDTKEEIVIEKDENNSISREKLVVDIQGAVKNPGVYELSKGDRVSDALKKAGGLVDEADDLRIAKTINLAALLNDGMKLYFPFEGEDVMGDTSFKESFKGVDVDSSSYAQGFISINNATESELDKLPGIGQITAKKIIDNRPYSAIEELITKKVISEKLFEKIKNQLSL
ncbi:MAG: ComE operon protein 1 [Patescibacteria group bacterium]|nr:MAG: ComE operon protein 1 [Patescibacteria group bacterium]